MTDAQLTILITALGTLGTGIIAALKWAVGRITAALDRNSEAMLKSVASNAVLGEKIDSVADWVEQHTPARGVPIPPAGGYGPMRPSTRGGDR